MTPAFRTLLALTGVLLSAPLAAKEPAPAPLPDLAVMDSKALAALFTEDDNRWKREPCTFGAPVLAALEAKAVRPVPVRRLRLIAEALCADREKRYADGAQLAVAITTLTPDDPATGLALYFARRLEDAASLIAILRGLDDAALGTLDKDDYWSVGRTVAGLGRRDDLDALALEWASGGKFAFLDTALHEGIAMAGLRAAAKAGRGDLAEGLLVSITSPVSYIEMLRLRSYAPFWPQIEARAGANLATIGDEHVRAARARLTNAPEDRDRFSEAAHALHYNGQFEEAIALAQRWRERAARGKAIEEGDAWALNIEAYAYDSLGQTRKADAVFEELAKYDPEEHKWVVNFVINRASRLVGQGRWREGLKATDLARKVADAHGSTYAKLIIANNRACALERLGRPDEATDELAYLRANWKEGVGLTAQGLLCYGLRDEATALLIEGLRNPAARDRTLGAFATDELDLFYTATILPQASDLLAAYPDLAAELALHSRPMPEAFMPQAALKRVARKEGAPR
ncbi:MAG: hypothetical protein O9293_09965 [Porphyrobacter sp.]|nr:hypothetical protein [Porphyrobacter sp.]